MQAEGLREITVPDDASRTAKSLRRRSNPQAHLRPVDLARMAGLGVTQIRTYERVGFLPPAERGANGYRRYSADHVEALRVSRILIGGYGWQGALDVMRAVHLRDRSTAYALVNSHHAALDSQRTRIAAALEATDAILRRSKEISQSRGRSAVHIKAAARTVGVRPSAVRFWERQGLLHPSREASTEYRLYDAEQLARLNVIALLRDVGYRFDAIRQVLDELSGGRPDQIRQALDARLETLNQTTWSCITATSTLHDYLESA
jgi:DNA-binding transcriptional MerR regulator